MDRGAWWAAVPGVTASWIWLSGFAFNFHFSLSCIGEENGNPLQCSCLENPRDGGAWWAAVYGVAQSRTRLKRLSSSSSSSSVYEGLSWWLSDKESACQFRRYWFGSWVGKIPRRRKLEHTPGFLPEKSHGQRNLASYSPQGHKRVRHDLWLNNSNAYGRRKATRSASYLHAPVPSLTGHDTSRAGSTHVGWSMGGCGPQVNLKSIQTVCKDIRNHSP